MSIIVTIADILIVVVPLLYAGVVTLYGLSFFGHASWLDRAKTRVLLITVAIHLSYLLLRTVMFDHPPVTTVFEIMTMLAACIAIGYTYIELRTRTSNTGFFILILAFLFQTVSSLFIKDLTDIPEILRSRLLGFHVSAALLGYTAISLSAVYGLLYLMLYHEIRSTRFGLIYKRLPNLEMLERMSHKAEVFGFVMLSVAIVVGLFWLPRAFASFSYWDPKLIGTLVIWILYAAGLTAKRQFGWQGRKTMIVSLVAFGFVFLSMTVINLYMSGFHSFH
jgi:ABC-type transport system involved in cytochrome c biogenesis permease subunit